MSAGSKWSKVNLAYIGDIHDYPGMAKQTELRGHTKGHFVPDLDTDYTFAGMKPC